VFLAKTALGMLDEAARLASSIVDGNQVSPEGYVIVGSAYAEWLIKNEKADEAFEFFNWIVKEAPTHRKAASSFYWLSLESLKRSENHESYKLAEAARKCFSGTPSLKSEWEIDSRCLTIMIDIDGDNKYSNGIYTDKYLSKQLIEISKDVKLLRQ